MATGGAGGARRIPTAEVTPPPPRPLRRVETSPFLAIRYLRHDDKRLTTVSATRYIETVVV